MKNCKSDKTSTITSQTKSDLLKGQEIKQNQLEIVPQNHVQVPKFSKESFEYMGKIFIRIYFKNKKKIQNLLGIIKILF